MWLALAVPRFEKDGPEVVGDGRAPAGAGLALGAPDRDPGRDLVAVEDVGPFEAGDLAAAQARVQGDRVGETVDRFQCGEKRGGFRRQGDA
jgi:hypothetical protein